MRIPIRLPTIRVDNVDVEAVLPARKHFRLPFKIARIWLEGWGYRKKITISGSSGAGKNYQVLLKVGESSGATGAHFHVEGHSAIFPSGKNNSGDLRFTDDDKTTLLSFWVESVTGTSPNRVAYCWVKVADDLGTNRDIYCYYGNSNATNVSNGNDTFVFFDDFLGTTLDTTKWVIGGKIEGGTVIVSDDTVKIVASAVANDKGIRSLSSFTGGYSLRMKVKRRPGGVYHIWAGFNTSDTWEVELVDFTMPFRVEEAQPNFFYVSGNGTNYQVGEWNKAKDFFFHIVEAKRTGTADNFVLDANTATGAYPTNLARYIELRDFRHTGGIECDWVLLRKYVSPEPEFYLAGPEEQY